MIYLSPSPTEGEPSGLIRQDITPGPPMCNQVLAQLPYDLDQDDSADLR
jgi:hypothetical protein